MPAAATAFLCDDDNDLALAAVVGKAFLPSVSAVSAGGGHGVRGGLENVGKVFLPSVSTVGLHGEVATSNKEDRLKAVGAM